MKKIIFGIVAIAAMGIAALSINGTRTPLFLTQNVEALARGDGELDYLCAYSPGDYCEYEFADETIPCSDYRRDDEPGYGLF